MSYPSELRTKVDKSDLDIPKMQKHALVSALDSAVTVVYECREFARSHPTALTSVEKQQLADALERVGRMCFSVARDLERPRAVEESSKLKAQSSKEGK